MRPERVQHMETSNEKSAVEENKQIEYLTAPPIVIINAQNFTDSCHIARKGVRKTPKLLHMDQGQRI